MYNNDILIICREANTISYKLFFQNGFIGEK